MKQLIEIYKATGNLHHAYLIEGEKSLIVSHILGFVEKDLEHPVKGNPDFHHHVFETLAIDDARMLRDMQADRPVAYPKKIFVIEFVFATVEAQQALLKTFEEPTPDTHFFIVVPSADVLLPTVRSRFYFLKSLEKTTEKKSDAEKFLKSSSAERLEMLEHIIEEKDKTKAVLLVDDLIKILHAQEKSSPELLKHIIQTRSYLNDRGASLKLLLENLAVTLP